MKIVTVTVVVALCCVRSPSLSAQWLKYPTAGVPRTPDGKPDMKAAPPKTADGRPDLSGIWDIEHNRPCPPGGCPDMEVGQEFVDIGWSLKGGLPYLPWAATERRKRMEADGRDDPASKCLPRGIVKTYTSPLMRKIVQTPGLVLILTEANTAFRQIFTDGRPLPEIEQPSFNGYSVGKWEGDALVVRTAGFTDGLWLDRSGSPLTDAARMTERIRRPSYGRLEIELTVDDPKAYTAPWTVTLRESLLVDTELLDYVCLENEKSQAHMSKK